MKPEFQSIYLQELNFQSWCGIRSYDSLLVAINKLKEHGASDPIETFPLLTRDVLRCAQSLVSHGTNVAKLLIAGGNTRKSRGRMAEARAESLREWLSIGEIPSALEKLRSLRNSLEHFDERLDDWYFTHSSSAFKQPMDRNALPSNTMARYPIVNIARYQDGYLRNLDTETLFYYFGNKQCDLKEIALLLDEVYRKTKGLHWWSVGPESGKAK